MTPLEKTREEEKLKCSKTKYGLGKRNPWEGQDITNWKFLKEHMPKEWEALKARMDASFKIKIARACFTCRYRAKGKSRANFVGCSKREGKTWVPHVNIDFTLETIPPKGGEIIFSKIRNIIYKLSELGVMIKWITFDQFQSKDSLQILRQKGYMVGTQSMERTPVPYELLKSALYDQRLSIPEHPKLLHELKTLERDSRTGKIDHAVNSSNDIADALAGAVYGLTMRRENWVKHGIPLTAIPNSIKDTLKSDCN